MFSSSVWVMIILLTGNTALPVGSFSTKDACISATKEAVIAQRGDPFTTGANAYCVPVEKPFYK